MVAFNPAFYWRNDGLFWWNSESRAIPPSFCGILIPQKLLAFYPRGGMAAPNDFTHKLSMAQHGVCGGCALTISLRITVESTGPVFFFSRGTVFFSEIPVASSNFSNSNVFNCNIGQIYLTVILYIN